MQVLWRSRRWPWILTAAAATPLLGAALLVWRTSHVRDEAAAEVLSRSEFPFRAFALNRVPGAGVESLHASPGFRDLSAFGDRIAVSARAGLFLYDRNGAPVRSWRAGMELPPAELGAMCAGVAAGAAGRELFIATRGDGLLVFDGARVRQILPADSGLRHVTAVLVTGSGRILMGTERNGLLVFDGRKLAPFHPRLRSAHITALAGGDGDLWIGTLANGVFHYRAGELEDLAFALPDPQVLSLLAEGSVAWAGTPLGVVEFRDGRRVRTLADGFFARALAHAGGTLQVGTADEGIVGAPPLEVPIVRLASVEGELYAVAEAAIYRFDRALRAWRSVLAAQPSLLADRNVAALALSGGRLWVGYFDRGLDVAEADLSRAIHHEDDTLFCINRIVPDSGHARTAVATANGLVLFDGSGTARQVLGRKDGLLADHVTDVVFYGDDMAVATPAGLSLVSRTGVRSLYVFHGLVNNHVYTLAAAGTRVLAGTLGGLSVLDDGAVHANYTTSNSHLKHNWITALERVGDEWFAGTYGAGVLRLDAHGEWHSFSDLPDGIVINPNAMAVTGPQIFAGSLDRGLFLYDRASGRWSSTTLGLPSRNVTALAVGGGQVYVGTDNGLVRIAEGALR
jgi:ligand-binding sensor domain-containing protein